MKKFLTKIKDYSFWTGLAGAAVILIASLGKAFGFEVSENIITDIIMGICGVLVVFGVVSKPPFKDSSATLKAEKSEEISNNESDPKNQNENN